jgi:hypothetical protein
MFDPGSARALQPHAPVVLAAVEHSADSMFRDEHHERLEYVWHGGSKVQQRREPEGAASRGRLIPSGGNAGRLATRPGPPA